jgi:hypothetical protein
MPRAQREVACELCQWNRLELLIGFSFTVNVTHRRQSACICLPGLLAFYVLHLTSSLVPSFRMLVVHSPLFLYAAGIVPRRFRLIRFRRRRKT